MIYLVAAITAAILLWAMFTFNRLVRFRNQVRAGWADIDVQLTRRHDLIPQLVESVRGYALHEASTLEEVTALRTKAMALSRPGQLAEVEQALEQQLGRLIALRESYPELKASELFLQLQRDLVDVEEHLQYARRFYNGAARQLNDGIQRFPDVLMARATGFAEAEFYAADANDRAAPRLDLSQ
ncbi:MAG: LemA family protein [Dokdonella sp.]